KDFTTHIDRDLARQIAVGDGDGHIGDIADLAGQITGHRIHVVGQVFPGAGHATDFCLAAELAFGADLPRHAPDFGSERVQLVHHGVDGVLQLENFPADIDRDLARKIAAGDGGSDFSNVADLGGEVVRHRVDVVGQVLPRAGHAFHFCLAAEFAL